MITVKHSFHMYYFFSDVNECAEDNLNLCSPKQFCSNTLGSFECVCNDFYIQQSPTTCIGKI